MSRLVAAGLGGTGGKVLNSLRTRLSESAHLAQKESVQYLHIDVRHSVEDQSTNDSILLDPPDLPTFHSPNLWDLLGIEGQVISAGASGRAMGALLGRANQEIIRERLGVLARSTLLEVEAPRVVIVASLSGGLGSGIVSAVAKMSREVFGPESEISGFFLLHQFFPAQFTLREQLIRNENAALSELASFSWPPEGAPKHALTKAYLISNEISAHPYTLFADSARPFDWISEYIEREVLRVDQFLYQVPAIPRDLAIVNEELLSYLRERPQLMLELSPRRFEELIAAVLKGLGYEVVLTKETRDGGKDLYVVQNSSLGNHLYLVECKKFARDRPVGVEIVRSLYGVVQQERATMGIVATTSYFTKEAIEFRSAVQHNLSLKDFDDLAGWLRAYSGPKAEAAR